MKQEELKLVLEALENAVRYHGIMLMSDPPQDAWKYHKVEDKADKAITAIKKALAQHDSVQAKPEPEQEPVAWFSPSGNLYKTRFHAAANGEQVVTPLYVHPPQRKPLTDEEIDLIYTGVRAVHHEIDSYVFARAIEAYLKEKNT